VGREYITIDVRKRPPTPQAPSHGWRRGSLHKKKWNSRSNAPRPARPASLLPRATAWLRKHSRAPPIATLTFSHMLNAFPEASQCVGTTPHAYPRHSGRQSHRCRCTRRRVTHLTTQQRLRHHSWRARRRCRPRAQQRRREGTLLLSAPRRAPAPARPRCRHHHLRFAVRVAAGAASTSAAAVGCPCQLPLEGAPAVPAHAATRMPPSVSGEPSCWPPLSRTPAVLRAAGRRAMRRKSHAIAIAHARLFALLSYFCCRGRHVVSSKNSIFSRVTTVRAIWRSSQSGSNVDQF